MAASYPYDWLDEGSKVVLSFQVPISIDKKKVHVTTTDTTISVFYEKPQRCVVVEGTLFSQVNAKKVTWKLKSAKVTVKLPKKKAGRWACFLQPELTADTVRARIESFKYVFSLV